MLIKVNAADAVDDPAIKNVINHLHAALAASKEVQTHVLLSALSNMIGTIAAGARIDCMMMLEAVRLDYLNQARYLTDRLEALKPKTGE